MSATATRQVLLVRHAHAEWSEYQGRDFDRPLTPRGEADAMATARAIGVAGLKPAVLLASPARRTRQTAVIIANNLGVAEAAIQFINTLYNASADTLAAELRNAPAGHGPVMLVAHNPGISELGRRLAQGAPFAPFAPAAWRLFPTGAM
ncbi:MAG TPA: histidine phosphatase family protein [Steroidobacteraceae bacterium]|nr:histidine phosphatase family protein [Steroidobacteraceae bacterium]